MFITALIHGLTRGGRFPVFEPLASGRIAQARLEPQPDDAVPRFDYETHVRTLIEERRWPNSTVDISELRLVIDYQRQNGADRTLTLDIVDYPGEWLLDLPLLTRATSNGREKASAYRDKDRAPSCAQHWHAHLATLSAQGREDEQAALAPARLFTEYLRGCRDERFAMSLLPPGRFLMPGNLAGSPALTFAPLDLPEDGVAPRGLAMGNDGDGATRPTRTSWCVLSFAIISPGSIARSCWSMRWRRSMPGRKRCIDLEAALAGILDCFRIGRSTLLSTPVPAADRPHPVRRHQGRSSAPFQP